MRFWSLVFITIFISACAKQSKVEVLHSFKSGEPNMQKYFPDESDTSYYIMQWFYPSGDTSATKEYHEGVGTGMLRCYHENGALKRTGIMVDDSLFNGEMIDYYDNGNLNTVINFKRETFHGPYYYFDECGQILLKTNYTAGVENGMCYIWHPNGALELSIEIIDGKEEGQKLIFYSNQNIKSISYFTNDTIDGLYLKYFANGCIMKKGMYEQDIAVGTWYYWNEDGSFSDSILRNSDVL